MFPGEAANARAVSAAMAKRAGERIAVLMTRRDEGRDVR